MRGFMMSLVMASFLVAVPAGAFQFPVNAVSGLPIEIDRSLFGTKYRQDGQIVKPMSVMDVVGRSPEGREAMGPAKGMTYGAMAFSAVGGVLIGFPLGQSLAGEPFNAPVFFTGVGVAAVGIVLGKMAQSRLNKGVEAYNGALPPSAALDWGWVPGGGRVALRVGF